MGGAGRGMPKLGALDTANGDLDTSDADANGTITSRRKSVNSILLMILSHITKHSPFDETHVTVSEFS
jgi:hypothetical protein